MRAITTLDVATRPAPGTTTPTQPRFSPDGDVLTFLLAEPGSLRQSLWAVDVATATIVSLPTPGVEVDEEDLSLEERLRRERARDLGTGVTRHAWAGRAPVLLVPMGDGLWVFDDPVLEDGRPSRPRLAVAADAVPDAILDAAVSADGSTLGFVCGAEVWVAPVDGSTPPRPVTSGAAGTGRTNGLAEFVAQEEMARSTGFWLSGDGTRLAYCEVDETHIPVYRIVHQGSDEVGAGAQEDHRYPFAGAENARVRLAITDTGGADTVGIDDEPRWIDLGATGVGDDRYLARVRWADADTLLVQVLNRTQDRLDLFAADATSGTVRPLLTETSEVWVNLHDDLRPLTTDGVFDGFVWRSERSGFARLEVHDADGSLRHDLAAPADDAVCTAVHAVDDTHVWSTWTTDLALGRGLFRIPLDGGPAEAVAVGPGVRTSVVGAGGVRCTSESTLEAPPVTSLVRADGSAVRLHDAAVDPRVDDLALAPPTLRAVTAEDGTSLHAAVYRPDGDGPFPTVIWVYGGPHAQLVTAGWSLAAALRPQYLRQQGFLVAVVDNRGAANRGLAFEGHLRHRLGSVEIDDQVRLVEDLVADGLADPDHVGIFGWSYGGYLSALSLARRPDVFRAACAGAPVIDWDGYDTCYTERYQGLPQTNPDGYRHSAVTSHVEGLRDRALLLVHGLIDENVHFRHTARLIDALVKADIDHRLLLYPGERHSPRSAADRASMERQITSFFTESLT